MFSYLKFDTTLDHLMLQSSRRTTGPTKRKQKKPCYLNYNIHIIYNLCFCKHQVPCEEYKLEMFALNNLIFTSHNFWEPYPRWEKIDGRSPCELYILVGMPHELMWHVMLCDMRHITCFKIRFEVAKLPPQTWSLPPHWVVDCQSHGRPQD